MEQIFKKQIPIIILYDLFDKIADIDMKDEYYTIDYTKYKKMLFMGFEKDFCETIEPYYHISKKHYVNREFTYNSFTTIIRQICKLNSVNFKTVIKYNQSTYNIIYYVYKQNKH